MGLDPATEATGGISSSIGHHGRNCNHFARGKTPLPSVVRLVDDPIGGELGSTEVAAGKVGAVDVVVDSARVARKSSSLNLRPRGYENVGHSALPGAKCE